MEQLTRFVVLVLVLVLLAVWIQLAAAATQNSDVTALKALQRSLDPSGKLMTWSSGDPCDNEWDGVICQAGTVTEIHLMNRALAGTIAPQVGDLSNLQILNFMWNNITGSIPPSIGKLLSLQLLLLNGNKLTGILPPELGNLVNLNRLQVDENMLSGPIPQSFGKMASVKHLHLNNNTLNGSIPSELGQLPTLFHLLADNNNLSGTLPPELSNISQFQILQLDNNQFDSSATVPPSYDHMLNLLKLSLRNCNLGGSMIDISGLSKLEYLDMSKNRIEGKINISGSVPENMTSCDLSNNMLSGNIPTSFSSSDKLKLLALQNNQLNGTIPDAITEWNESNTSGIILNFQNNSLSGLTNGSISEKVQLWVSGNSEICNKDFTGDPRFCVPNSFKADDAKDNVTGSCDPAACIPGQNEVVPALAYEATCRCASPIKVVCRLKSPGFVFFSAYESDFQQFMANGLSLGKDQLYVASHTLEPGPRFLINLKIFPAVSEGQRSFNRSEVLRIFQMFASWKIPDNPIYGPREFLSLTPPFGIEVFPNNAGSSRQGISKGGLAGLIIGVIAATAVVVGVVVLRLSPKHRKTRSSRMLLSKSFFSSVKLDNVRSFTLAEVRKATDSFSEARVIGKGGYGKVYKGVLDDQQVVAIKRAEGASYQGGREFFTEIELLSRIHHRNLVSLIGFCLEDDEQMLLYEYIAGGSLSYRLSENAKLSLNFRSRVYIALGAARGILYLHTEADPPIIHRDIKGTNILVGEKNVAKVADFGLSRLAPEELIEDASRHVSTVVKGTPGYLDPEYFLTRKLSDKSDIYSFGVVLLELITGRQAIYQNKNLLREVRASYEAGVVVTIVDPRMGAYPSESLEPFVRLALACCADTAEERPAIRAVVRDLESIWRSLMKSQVSFSDDSELQLLDEMMMESSSSPSSSKMSGFFGVAMPR